MNIDELILATNNVLGIIRKPKPCDKIPARFMEPIGIKINDVCFWPVRRNDFVNNAILPEDGAVIRYRVKIDTTFRYIKNSFYE